MNRGAGSARAADAVLRACGGSSARLQVPLPATAGDDAEQLGLATPGFQQVALQPVAWRRSGETKALLVSGSAVLGVVQTLAYASAEVLFATAAGIEVDEVLYEIADCEAMQADGGPYAYVLTLRAPVRWEAAG